MVKSLPAVWETLVPSLDWKGPLEKRMVYMYNIYIHGNLYNFFHYVLLQDIIWFPVLCSRRL